MITRLSFVAVALSLAACGDSAPSATEALEENNEVVCAKVHECRDTQPFGTFFEQIFGNSVSECLTIQEQSLPAADVQASIDAGRIVYNADDAEVCLAFDIAGLTCDAFWNSDDGPPECDTVFVGQVADGGQCTTFLDCANDEASCVEGICSPQ